ncbi:MAG: ribose 5-phosphate isomerase B [Patescibacteria group bacterium]
MKIYLGADHRGFELKNFLKEELKNWGYQVYDLGNEIYDPNDDYPDFAFKVGEMVRENKESLGILICGSGAGVCFAVNKIKGIRGALVYEEEMAKMAKADDNINVLCLAADFVSKEKVLKIVKAFIETPFKNEEKYLRRIKKVEDYENSTGN